MRKIISSERYCYPRLKKIAKDIDIISYNIQTLTRACIKGSLDVLLVQMITIHIPAVARQARRDLDAGYVPSCTDSSRVS